MSEQLSYEERMQKQYQKKTRVMKITTLNTIITIISFLVQGIIGLLLRDLFGFVFLGLAIYFIIILFYYLKLSINAKAMLIFSYAFFLFFFQSIVLIIISGHSVIGSNFIVGSLLLIYGYAIVFIIGFNVLGNLLSEETNKLFQFPRLIPSDI